MLRHLINPGLELRQLQPQINQNGKSSLQRVGCSLCQNAHASRSERQRKLMKAFAAISLFAWLANSGASAQIEMTRIPIDYKEAQVSFEMPRKWAHSEFGFKRVPPDIEQHLSKSGEYVICMKDLTWSRSFFRGPLGTMTIDVSIMRPFGNTDGNYSNPSRTAELRKLLQRVDFRKPRDLYEYYRFTIVDGIPDTPRTISYERLAEYFWVRLTRQGAEWSGIPTDNIWVLGLDRDTYLRIDLGVSRENSGPQGESWQKSALYWQNKLIDSIRVTGLKQIPAGDENAAPWQFPSGLEYAPGLLE